MTITGGDSEPPILASTPVVTPSSIDVAGGADTVVVDFDLTDNATGVWFVIVEFERGDTLTPASAFASLVSGDNLNGSWRGNVIVPQNADGQFDLRITAIDGASNILDTNLGPALTVSGGDTVLPSVSGTPILDRSAVNVGGGDQDVKVTLTALDTYSGIASVNAYFMDDSGNNSGSSYLTTLVSGDSLNGTWELTLTFFESTPEGTYHLLVNLDDVAGNYVQVEFPGVTVVVNRAPEADVTFRLDGRRLERLGLLLRGGGYDPTVRIFEGPNAGTYQLADGDSDSIWTVTVIIQTGQSIHYTFALPSTVGDILELDGASGGRLQAVDSTGALVLPIQSFDNLDLSDVDPGYAVVLNRGFAPGDSPYFDFYQDTTLTYFSADFASLDRDAIVAVRRYATSPGGSPPSGIATMAPLYWGIASAPAGAVYTAKIEFEYGFFGGVTDPPALRLLRRTDGGQPWEIVPTILNSDKGTIGANGVSNFSDWAIASTSGSNTLVPSAPGLVGNPNPPDSSEGVGRYPTRTWGPAAGAYRYDITVWPATESMPVNPTAANLTQTSFGQSSPLQYGASYLWKVVAKNIVGSTPGPVWTFTTQEVADLVVSDVQVPGTAFSGQAIEVGWTVTNTGVVGTTSPAWGDRFYLSLDSVLIPGGDAYLGEAQNPTALGAGESYSNSRTFVIPRGLFGTYRLIAVTDGGYTQAETNEGNNIFIRDLPVTLTPPPDLRVDVVSVPASGFSGQDVPLLYTVKNYGPNTTTSSQWYDAAFISTDSIFGTTTAKRLLTIQRTQALQPESSYTVSHNVRLPDTASGPRYIFVFTDITNIVFEYGFEDNNSRRSDIEVSLSPPPDLVVTGVIAPGTGSSGAGASVQWTVVNQGSADAFANWRDRVLIGRNAVYDPDSVTVLGTFSNLRGLARDSLYTRQASVTLPNGASGPYYVFVETDWKKEVFEYTFESNNILVAAAPTVISLSPWPDLRLTSISVPGNAGANDLVTVNWMVENAGSAGIPSGFWTDSLYLSTTDIFDSSSSKVLAGVGQNRSLAASESYSAQTQVRIPPDLAGGGYYIHVITDRLNTVYEHSDEANNVREGGPITITAYPPVDLSVVSLSSGAAGASGTQFPMEFTISNIGAGATLAGSWSDVVYLSSDTSLDYGSDIRLGRFDRSLPLPAGGSYTRTTSPALPEGLSGNFYLFVRTDSASAVSDANIANNKRRSPGQITISLSPSPDMRMVFVGAPPAGQAGQPIVITSTVDNAGADIPTGKRWFDGVYLSPDAVVDYGDIRLATVERNGPLGNGETYSDSHSVVVPEYASGTYYILAKVDSRNEIYEHNSEANNTAGPILTVSLSPPADLVVSAIVAPPSGVVGEDITIEWTIRNQGVNPATGRLTDAVYFSSDSVWDISDLLLGTNTRDINLAPGAASRAVLRANLASAALADSTASVVDETPGLFPGDYYVIVRTDVRNNIRESDNANNRAPSASTVNVDVPILTLGVVDTGSISSASPRRYKVVVPANLDLRITATSSVAYPSIDLFSAYGRMPTGNSYDHRTSDPTSTERELFVPSTQAGVYYLLMRSIIDPSQVVTETYSVLAETLGFAIGSVTPGDGGSGGFVTGTILGAGFRETSRIFLYNGSQRVAEAELRVFRSTMEMLVRWDLRAVPLGTYDVEVENQDLSTARLTAAFRVDPMRDPAISIGKNIPRVLLVGRKETYGLRFANTSNVDIPYFAALIASPAGTEIEVVPDHERLLTRSMLVPDSLIPEGETVEDWIENASARFVPLIGRDLAPGEAYNARVTFRNPAYTVGTNFPMFVTTRTATKEAFLEIQLAQVEAYRAQILGQGTGADPEYLARANDPVAFAQYALQGYVAMGLLDSADVPAVGLENIARAATGPWSGGSQSPAPIIVPRLQSPLMVPDPNCVAFFNFIACPAAIIDCFIDLPFIPPPFSFALCGFGVATSCLGFDFGDLNYIGCIGIASGITCIAKEFLCRYVAFSYDPNDITGPDGEGDERWVARQQTLPYTIRFENDSLKAIVPARRVTVTQQLDTTADIRSIRLSSFGFGRHVFQVPVNVSTYTDRLDLRDSMGIFVDVTAGIDIVNGRISWTLNSIDPVTGDAPADPFAGLLPVNDTSGSGQGFVTYTVRPHPSARTRDTIHAKATIVFDQNDPIDTPPVFNLVDAVPPVSSVRPLPPTIDITSFPVHWGGVEDSAGSGMRHYTIYSSVNGGPYAAWLTNVTDTIAVFTGNDSSQYSFFSVSTDTAGNVEGFKSSPEATTMITVGVGEEEEQLPKAFALAQNYPNPFNPTTMVRYDVPAAAWVRLTIYNVLGQEVATLVDGPEDPGRKTLEWSALNRHGLSLPSGVYFYRMEAASVSDPSVKFRDVKKMILVR
ncbi:MAG TPA: CARDB domain-containing protein [Bacteroidota bacterium]|nr:CARDB domain-containing protein [Bacteroidota bacterium]